MGGRGTTSGREPRGGARHLLALPGQPVPLPPGLPADGDPAQWVHLPSRGVSLASPVALLELLAKAISAIRDDAHAFTLPGGVRAVPVPYPMLPPGQS